MQAQVRIRSAIQKYLAKDCQRFSTPLDSFVKLLRGIIYISIIAFAALTVPNINLQVFAIVYIGAFVLMTILLLRSLFILKVSDQQLSRRYESVDTVARKLRALPADRRLSPTTSYNMDIIINDADRSNKDHLQFHNCFRGKDYIYGECSYYSYATIPVRGRPRYRSAKNYLSVVQVDTDNQLPDFIFDSPYLDGMQFLKYTSGGLKAGVSGHFIDRDDPTLHTSKSWKVIKKLPHCDIEIEKNHLIIYAPLAKTSEISQLINHALKLKVAIGADFRELRKDTVSI